MHVAIRRYETDASVMPEIKEKVETIFLPEISRIRGFVAYYAVNCGDGDLATVSVFETEEGTRESTRLSGEFAKKYFADKTHRLSVDEGELLVERHASQAV